MEFAVVVNNQKFICKQFSNLNNFDYFIPLFSHRSDNELIYFLLDINAMYSVTKTNNFDKILSNNNFNIIESGLSELDKIPSYNVKKIKQTIPSTGLIYSSNKLCNNKKVQEFCNLFYNSLVKEELIYDKNYVVLPGIIGIKY